VTRVPLVLLLRELTTLGTTYIGTRLSRPLENATDARLMISLEMSCSQYLNTPQCPVQQEPLQSIESWSDLRLGCENSATSILNSFVKLNFVARERAAANTKLDREKQKRPE
jgi:hypothetical protein